jgi:hypothetical protein
MAMMATSWRAVVVAGIVRSSCVVVAVYRLWYCRGLVVAAAHHTWGCRG